MIFSQFVHEIDTIIARDPAARSRLEVVLCYPSLHSLLFYRFTHWLWQRKFYLLARFISNLARIMTGIEIHPGAQIGKDLFIDHGMGVVIGETSVIGDQVTLYQGVTLGGISPSEKSDAQRSVKRHPTVEDNVIVGSGAQILGDIVIGTGARVGANAVVTRNVEPHTTVVGVPAKPSNIVFNISQFSPYGVPTTGTFIDPLLAQIENLQTEIETLKLKIQETEKSLPLLLAEKKKKHLSKCQSDS